MTPGFGKMVVTGPLALLLAHAAPADVADDVNGVLRTWGQATDRAAEPTGRAGERAETTHDRNADGTIDARDLVLALAGEKRTGNAPFRGPQAQQGTSFIGIDCHSFVGDGWTSNGYGGLETFRVYALFEPVGADRGVIAVFGVEDQPLSISSTNGAFHNDADADSMTAPQDLRIAGIWSNQWDTYVAINATDAADDGVVLSPGFAEATNNLSTDWSNENGGWLVIPDSGQGDAQGDRVLLGQFTVEAGIDVFGSFNLLLMDGHTPIDVEFFCASGGGGAELGACCVDDGASCRTTTENACVDVFAGVFEGVGTDCLRQIVDTPCHPGASGQHCVRVLATCPELDTARGECEPGLLLDAWLSPEEESGGSQTTYHDFGAEGQAIPADFFAFGSDPLTDVVTLKSVPIGGEFGEADTLLRRSADPFERCMLPTGQEVAVDIEVFFLSLASAEPVRITYLGGQHEQLWDLSVALSVVRPDPGTLRAIKTTCNGGTYSVEDLRVFPQFTFRRVENPDDIRVFDTGILGLDPVVLSLEEGHWVSDVEPNFNVFSPYCTDFRPGVVDGTPPANCDCNGNLRRDACDIEDGESVDCNLDGVPDDCELDAGAPDCNKNGVLDACECPGDVVSDCVVGFDDILAVISAWGPCGGCPEDVTRDGLVGYADVLEILRTWGPCASE